MTTPYKKLYDIPSLPMEFLQAKMATTQMDYSDPNTINNFMNDVIRDRGSERPVFEHELPRRSNNVANNALLSMQEYGSRYSHDPYHPELFMGDLTKDQRQSDTAPLVVQMADQHKFRHDRYIHGKLQDSPVAQLEGVVGTKRMVKQVRDGFYNTASRYNGVFDDSFNVITQSSSARPSKTILSPEDTIKEEQAYYQVGDEKILPNYSTDIVSKLGNLLGVNWQVEQDVRYGLSSVSNVYRSKGEVDQAINAVFREGQQDTRIKEQDINITERITVPKKDLIKQARKIYQDVVVGLKNDSKNNKSKKITPLPANISKVLESFETQEKKVSKSNSNRALKLTFNTKKETLVEQIKTHDITEIVRGTTIPPKDKLAIAKKIERMQGPSKRTEDTIAVKSQNVKSLANALIKRVSAEHEQKKARQHKQQFTSKNSVPVKGVDHVSNNKLSKKKFAEYKERLQTNQTGSNILQRVSDINDFITDIDPTLDNKFQTRKGAVQRIAQLRPRQDQDNTISPVDDMIAPFSSKYAK